MVIADTYPQKRVAILIENGVEDVEFEIPKAALREIGVEVVVLAAVLNQTYKGKQGKTSTRPDNTTALAQPEEFDAIIIPGGQAPDKMRTHPFTVNFVKRAMELDKLVAAVCHGPQVLIEADVLQGKNATGFTSIRRDMENAGATYIDKAVVIDDNLITSRRPGDLAIFTTAICDRLGLGGQHSALPDLNDPKAQWWKLADAWGGSRLGEIESAIATSLRGAHYLRQSFGKSVEKVSDPEIRSVLQDIELAQEETITRLEQRLSELGKKGTGKGSSGEIAARLQSVFESGQELVVLRHAIADLEMAELETKQLSVSLTDPVTVNLLEDIAQRLNLSIARLANMHRQHFSPTSEPVAGIV